MQQNRQPSTTRTAPAAAANDEAPQKRGVGLLATLGSVLMAMFGVQSSKARERDFSRGNPKLFIAVGILLTAAFAGTIVLVVKLLLRNAGM
ncbi:MAG: DUF2970 domain-containing protein [Solimonas sp.]